MRILLFFLSLAIIVLIPFLIWGGRFEAAFGHDGTIAWLRDYGAWAWAAAILLLILDLFLPVPATMVFSGLGFLYGAWLGGFIGAAGSILSGVAAYTGCRMMGRRAAVRIAGERDLIRAEDLFSSVGGWIVALSRSLPIFSETVACLAGPSAHARESIPARARLRNHTTGNDFCCRGGRRAAPSDSGAGSQRRAPGTPLAHGITSD